MIEQNIKKKYLFKLTPATGYVKIHSKKNCATIRLITHKTSD